MTHKPRFANQLRWMIPALAGTVSLFAGCSNMSGLGGSSEMTCSAPPGVPCMSVSGVHANASAGTLPSQRGAAAAGQGDGTPQAVPALHRGGEQLARLTPLIPSAEDAPSLGAIRSEPTLIRIWIAPWEDADGDLHSDSYVYLQVDSGRWLIEHNRERVRRQFAPMPASASAPAAVPAGAVGPAVPAKAAPQAHSPQRTVNLPSQGGVR
jgi:conjugal transfer pilus assembly protein TraV